MAVLVTGGAGYIGSHTVRLLAQQQREVVVLDSLELGTKSRIGSVPFFEGNISDEKLIEKICKKHNIDEVIHFAAYKAVGESMEQTTSLLQQQRCWNYQTSCVHCSPMELNVWCFHHPQLFTETQARFPLPKTPPCSLRVCTQKPRL